MSEGSFSTYIKQFVRGIRESNLAPDEQDRLLALLELSISFDPITEFLNGRSLEKRLDEEIARAKRHERKLTVVIVGIDDFFQYNSTYGNKQGDLALQLVANVISLNRRKGDILSRYEGGNFLIVIPETDENGARIVANHIIEKIKSTRLSKYVGLEREQDKTYTSERGYQELAVSIGIVKYSAEIDAAQTFIKLSESAMIDARKSGTNRIAFYQKPT